MVGPTPWRILSEQERSQILEQNLIAMTMRQGHVETRTWTQAVVVFGKPVNHVLHLLLSVLCCCFWPAVWAGVTPLGGERRTTLAVDQYGNVLSQREPLKPHQIILLTLGALWLAFWLVAFIVGVASSGDSTTSSSALTATWS